MAFSSPQLVTSSARVDECVITRAGNDSFIFASKNHKGSPLREMEIYTVADVKRSLTGPNFFNVKATVIELLHEVFRFISAITISSQSEIDAGGDPIIRFYWNSIAGRNTDVDTILTIDYNTVTKTASSKTELPFKGLDPFIIDARTGAAPNRLYLAYIDDSNRQVLRETLDLGITWSTGCAHDQDVKYVEGILLDEQDKKELVRVMQLQSQQITSSLVGDAFINDFTTAAVPLSRTKKLYPFKRRPPRLDARGKDLNRFREMYPLVRRITASGRSPC